MADKILQLIPFSGIQILDFELDLSTLSKKRTLFREDLIQSDNREYEKLHILSKSDSENFIEDNAVVANYQINPNEALKLFKKEKYDDARFLFERNIVFNPKDANSYLYLAKIYNQEENQRKEEYNLETTLLIEPDNEEALLMLMKIALEKSNYEKVKDLSDKFVKVCKNLCDENKDIQESLKNIEPENNES